MSYCDHGNIGGPWAPPEPKFWEPEDGCPDCGRELESFKDGYECDYCDAVFDLDGFPVAAQDLEPVDEPEWVHGASKKRTWRGHKTFRGNPR